MKKLILTLLVVAGLVSTIVSQDNSSVEQYEDGAFRSATVGAQVFSAQLYEVIAKESEGNVVLAPLSVAVLLALLRMGFTAPGTNALQLTDALHVGQDAFLIAQGYRELIGSLPSSSDTPDSEVTLFLENRMFVQEGFDIEEDFEETAENDFRSGVQGVDFLGDTQESQQIINDWVENATMGRITNLIQNGSLSPDTKLVMVNAIYFKGEWVNPFNEEDTTDEPFHTADSGDVSVPMMRGSFRAQYGEATNADATTLTLPYKDTDMQVYMMIILPNSVDGLAEIEKNLYQLEVAFETREVQVLLPKFEFESSTQLNEDLKKLGITAIFGPGANLRGISDQDLYVDQMIQKALISVNENGTEASAATAIGAITTIAFPPANFTANHPFLFVIRDTDNIYFMGRVENPLQ